MFSMLSRLYARAAGLFCLGLCLLAVGCAPLGRDVRQGEVLSSAKPALTATSTLPFRLGGRAMPFINSDLGLVTPQAWVAVYGGETPNAPLAIVALSVAPDGMVWDLPSFCYVDGPVTSEVAFGERNFAGAVRELAVQDDAFAPLLATRNRTLDEGFRWLVQRYTLLENFRQSKIVLEYREPLPTSFQGLTALPIASAEMEAFAVRAKAAFKLAFASPGELGRAAPLEGVNQRYLGKFLGSLSPLAPPFPAWD